MCEAGGVLLDPSHAHAMRANAFGSTELAVSTTSFLRLVARMEEERKAASRAQHQFYSYLRRYALSVEQVACVQPFTHLGD